IAFRRKVPAGIVLVVQGIGGVLHGLHIVQGRVAPAVHFPLLVALFLLGDVVAVVILHVQVVHLFQQVGCAVIGTDIPAVGVQKAVVVVIFIVVQGGPGKYIVFGRGAVALTHQFDPRRNIQPLFNGLYGTFIISKNYN